MSSNINFERVLAFGGDCSICHDDMLGKPALAHGKCEPLHEACLKTWLEVSKTCPLCRGTVDVDSLFSWKERALIPLKVIIKDVRIAAGIAVGVGAIAARSMLANAIVIKHWEERIPREMVEIRASEVALIIAAAAVTGALAGTLAEVAVARVEERLSIVARGGGLLIAARVSLLVAGAVGGAIGSLKIF